MLDYKNHIEQSAGCLYRHVRSDTEYFRLHYHNYYEIFMVLKGNVCHLVNGKTQNLSAGHLLFIRDFDMHDYKSADGNYFEFINLAFSKESFEAMCNYLGENSHLKALLNLPLPPAVFLPAHERERLFFSMTDLGAPKDAETIKLMFKILLIKVFTKNFMNYPAAKNEVPLWLEMVYEKMKQPAYFIEGIDKMYEICPKSREHLCRSLKKYYNTSPVELITNLRLEFSLSLLTTSNLTVTEICYECGFENLSWFYKVFYKKFGQTPSQYRKNNNLILYTQNDMHPKSV